MADDATSGWAKLLQTALEALSGRLRNVVITGLVAVFLVVVVCLVVVWRMSIGVEPSALAPALLIMLDAKLLILAGAVIAVILLWLGGTLYALYRSR